VRWHVRVDEVDGGIEAHRAGGRADPARSPPRAAGDRAPGIILPQIAAYADQHFHVEKTEAGGRTETHVRRLSASARKDELARMLGGHATSKAKAHAAELLADAAGSRARARKPAGASATR
jgi:DNA repair protein RecN (Recombination protein N)